MLLSILGPSIEVTPGVTLITFDVNGPPGYLATIPSIIEEPLLADGSEELRVDLFLDAPLAVGEGPHILEICRAGDGFPINVRNVTAGIALHARVRPVAS